MKSLDDVDGYGITTKEMRNPSPHRLYWQPIGSAICCMMS